jgi:CheY-like chemotaxis protein
LDLQDIESNKLAIMETKKILLVDDSVVARLFMIRHLEANYSDWQILQASDAKEALEILKQHKCNIMTIDYNMPNTNGLELVDKVRELKYDVKIVMLTANIQKTLKDEAEKKGILFLEKPITIDTVEKIMNYERSN